MMERNEALGFLSSLMMHLPIAGGHFGGPCPDGAKLDSTLGNPHLSGHGHFPHIFLPIFVLSTESDVA
jgi:hypothetical protein